MQYIARVLILALMPGLAFAAETTGNVIDLTNHTAICPTSSAGGTSGTLAKAPYNAQAKGDRP